MGKGNLYYLVARNKKNNNVEIVEINNQVCCSLEVIDLFTTKFSDEKDLANMLYQAGLITDTAVDLFIVNQNSKHDIYTQEILYNYAYKIPFIAVKSLNNRIRECSSDVDEILDNFAEKMETVPKYYEMVAFNDTNIYRKYINYFENENLDGKVRYDIKYKDGSFARNSYKLIRNIVEANNRFNTYKYSTYNINRNQFYRKLLTGKLTEITDKNYQNNQLSFFDDMSICDKSNEEKILEVISVFDTIPRSDFTVENGDIVINKRQFVDCSMDDYNKIECLLGDYLLAVIHRLAKANDLYKLEVADSTRNEIYNLLSNDETVLNLAYEWCRVYTKYKDFYGDVDGYQYKKD